MPSKKIKKRTGTMPCPCDFPFLPPHFPHVLHLSPSRREPQHHTFWQCQLFQLLKYPCVAEGLYQQLFQENNSQAQFLLHSNVIFFSAFIMLVASIVSDEWYSLYYTKFRNMLKKHWHSKNLVYPSIHPSFLPSFLSAHTVEHFEYNQMLKRLILFL